MRIAMMGSGGIGGYLGARLAQSGEDIVFIARGTHLEAMQRDGLRLRSPLGDIVVPRPNATDRPDTVGPVDVVVFAVKLYDSEPAARRLIPLVGPATRIVTFQNGIDSVDTLARTVPRSQVVGGVIYVSAHMEQPGVIVHIGGPTKVRVGGRHDPPIEALQAACLRAGGIDIEAVGDIDGEVWMKFVTLAAFAGATSLMRAGIGRILADREACTFFDQLRHEGMAVAAAAGHSMPTDFEANTVALMRSLPSETRSSMSADLGRGKALELDWLSGRMHELGTKLGVATPAHTAVYRALHLHSAGDDK